MRGATKRACAKGCRRGGHAVIEIALFLPWILLLFLGVFNFGFFSYALISVENAARVAALYTSAANSTANDSNFACYYAIEELRTLPNIGRSLNCPGTCAAGADCTAGPLTVRAQLVPAADSADGRPASRVAVTYQTVQLFPLPWLAGRLTIRRVVEMRI